MRTRISHQPIGSGFCCQVCRLVKLQFGDCLYCFWSNQLLGICLHRWRARGCDCRCSCWLADMRQYLSHRSRLCDKANQAHPPAAPAALERKHPVDARQQLCPQLSRRVSAPRSAAVCIRCLWPRGFAPRRQLPPSLRRDQRPPPRVRRQHPKVAVPMLAQWWYQ